MRLALSLHAPEDSLRSELMPVNERYPLHEVLAACRRWSEARRSPVFVEYLMLDGVNDRYEQAVALARLLGRDRTFKVNLIPYNPTEAGFAGSSRPAIDAFRAALAERGVTATVRLTRGREIDAACGQLAARERSRRGSDRGAAGVSLRRRPPAGRCPRSRPSRSSRFWASARPISISFSA